MESLLRTGLKEEFLLSNRQSYYKNEISWSRQLFEKADITRESVYLRTIDRKLTLNLIVIFNSFTDIYFLKYVAKIFCIFHYFQEIFGSGLRCSFQWLCLCIFY